MGIDVRGVARTQEIGDILRHAGVQSGRADAKADCIAFADRIDREHAAGGIVCWAITIMFSNSLTRFFGSSTRGRFHAIVVLPSSR